MLRSSTHWSISATSPAVLGQGLERIREPLAPLDLLDPAHHLGAQGGEIQARVDVGIALQAGEPAAQEGERAPAVRVAEVVEAHRDLDQALEEIAGGPPDPRPHILQGVVALEEEAGVELDDPLLEAAALLVVEHGLGDGRALGHQAPGEVSGSSVTPETARARSSVRCASR